VSVLFEEESITSREKIFSEQFQFNSIEAKRCGSMEMFIRNKFYSNLLSMLSEGILQSVSDIRIKLLSYLFAQYGKILEIIS